MKYDVGVIIGRFQPFHQGHKELFEAALAEAQKLVIVIGSSESARSIRNPWTVSEREDIIQSNFIKDRNLTHRIHFVPVRDYFYNNQAWVNEVRQKVFSVSPAQAKIALFGHSKDETSAYLQWFPEWEFINKNLVSDFHATQIRENYLRSGSAKAPGVSEETQSILSYFAQSPVFKELQAEQLMIDKYKDEWKSAPYPPVFVTTDAMVLQSGHVLLVRRGRSPGKNLWALPGGFLESHERLNESAIRELYEETQIDIPKQDIEKSLVKVETFDHPLRSVRGRTITHVHCYQLKGDRLMSVRANDDAAECKWVPVLDLSKMEDHFFEDHFHIISRMLGSF